MRSHISLQNYVDLVFENSANSGSKYFILNNVLTPQNATRCICTVTVPQDVNVDVKRLYDNGNCASFVNMVDEEDQTTDFCLAGELQCKTGGRELHFEYIPNGQTVSYLSISGQYRNTMHTQLLSNSN